MAPSFSQIFHNFLKNTHPLAPKSIKFIISGQPYSQGGL